MTILLFSYIDPVSGVILMQVIVAGVLGCAAFFRRSIFRVLRLLTPWKSSDKDSADGETSK